MGTAKKREVTAAWAVHAFTTSGVVLGFLAMVATLEGDKTGAFLWLGLALFVDGIDGTLARGLRISEILPSFDGSTLDSIVDYFTYVIIPALMIWTFDLVPNAWETAIAAAILSVSCYTFSNLNAKSEDDYFVGFPALWNLLVLYFHILQTGPWVNLFFISVCLVLTFVPLRFVHPFRVKERRKLNLPITVLWAATSFRLVMVNTESEAIYTVSPLTFYLWCFASSYFVVLCIWCSVRFINTRRTPKTMYG
ncbi:MAG: phosphatidylcholine synthase [Waddliaceae bacterium]|nr:phosphatidylcholine synthase [Waddliaceae bacterium]